MAVLKHRNETELGQDASGFMASTREIAATLKKEESSFGRAIDERNFGTATISANRIFELAERQMRDLRNLTIVESLHDLELEFAQSILRLSPHAFRFAARAGADDDSGARSDARDYIAVATQYLAQDVEISGVDDIGELNSFIKDNVSFLQGQLHSSQLDVARIRVWMLKYLEKAGISWS
ncbi:MAG: hypothetical protein KF808_06860 [Cryobacterium sp.]|nr:hypothetical protein [Cryobacterium sp.]